MRPGLLALSCLFASACADGTSVLDVTVGSVSSVDGVYRLHVQLTNVSSGRPAQPVDLTLAGAPISIPPTQAFALVLPRGTSGKLHVDVSALDQGGRQLGSGSNDISVSSGKTAALTVTLGIQVVEPGDMGGASDGPSGLPQRCSDIRAAQPGAGDGNYTVYYGADPHQPWTVFCRNMASTPIDYLPLVFTGASNFANALDPQSSLTTWYSRVHIDPITLQVDINDQTYSMTAGKYLTQTAPLEYATSLDCILNGGRGQGNVDLRGTALAVQPAQFVADGSSFLGNVAALYQYSSNNQVVNYVSGGDCGWTVPRPDFSIAPPTPDFHLQLYYPKPMTCAAIKARDPGAADGSYTLYVNGDPAEPWTATCKNMDTAPAEYLMLPNSGAGQNYAQYTDPAGVAVVTSYKGVRVDGLRMLIDVDDRTFATTTGASGVTSAMPYGTAEGCSIMANAGKLDIDLRGTPFALPVGSIIQGGAAGVSAQIMTSNANQTVDAVVQLTSGSGCGWVEPAPSSFDPRVPNAGGGFHLQLAYAPVSCAQIKASGGSPPDGYYTLFVNGDSTRQWQAWCAGMNGTPAEYLTLASGKLLGSHINFAQLISAGQTVETTYDKVRLDPVTLKIDISDKTFATSTGTASANGHNITSVPFGVAVSCDPGVTAKANVYTPSTYMVIPTNSWVTGGSGPTGAANSNGVNVDITGSGSGGCAWTVPGPVFDPTATSGTFSVGLGR